MTLAQDFTITLTEPVNLRDLGGIAVADGTVEHGFAVRSDDLATITHQTAQQLVADGLASVIDLRSRDEVFVTGRGPLLDTTVNYHHVPLLTSIGQDMAASGPDASAVAAVAPLAAGMPPMYELYVQMFERAAGSLVSALGIMAYSPGATAFHCAAGKDRTGTLAAALLLALGAEDAAIIEDYRATYAQLDGIGQRTESYLGRVMALAGWDMETMREQLSRQEATHRSEDAMAETLRILRDRYTDPLTPLYEAGLTTGLIDALRHRAVTA